MTGLQRRFWLGACLGLVTTLSFSDDEPTYSVECEPDARSATQCVVDKGTYIGWRTYNSACSHCHAQDGVGSTFAPSLVAGNAAVRDFASFKQRTNEGVEGTIGVMPAFKDNPNINDKITEIYQYLKARSDERLPPGRPER